MRSLLLSLAFAVSASASPLLSVEVARVTFVEQTPGQYAIFVENLTDSVFALGLFTPGSFNAGSTMQPRAALFVPIGALPGGGQITTVPFPSTPFYWWGQFFDAPPFEPWGYNGAFTIDGRNYGVSGNISTNQLIPNPQLTNSIFVRAFDVTDAPEPSTWAMLALTPALYLCRRIRRTTARGTC